MVVVETTDEVYCLASDGLLRVVLYGIT